MVVVRERPRVRSTRRRVRDTKPAGAAATAGGSHVTAERTSTATAITAARFLTPAYATGDPSQGGPHGRARANGRNRGDPPAEGTLLPLHGHEGLGRLRERVRTRRGDGHVERDA